jgi:uncharacterized protein (TIGR04141 family)
MDKVAEKWQVGIYQIHNTNEVTKEVYTKLENETDYDKKQNFLKRKLLIVDDTVYKYNFQKLIVNTYNDFELFLFYRKHKKSIPDWKKFFSPEVTVNAEIHTNPTNMNESFVYFLYHKNDKKLYAICGGYGIFTIQKYIQDDFGINILIRLLSDKGDKVLRYAKEFGVTGGVIGITKHFRESNNFYENKNFGNIYREILASVDKDALRRIGIIEDEAKNCIAKDSFKVNYSIKYEKMLDIVEKLNHLIKSDANFDINDIKKIDSNKNHTLVESLKNEILNLIWVKRASLEELDESFDFVHKKFHEFLLADKYKVKRTEFTNINTLFYSVIQNVSTNTDKDDFINNMQTCLLHSYNDMDTEPITTDRIYNHLVGEVQKNGNNYFLINGDFYQITSNFISILNLSCKNFIKENFISRINKPWANGDRESVYNLLYKDELNKIVLDTITPESIELCDILEYDEDNVYLYHVKKGFNGSMRDLTNQVFTSANRLVEDLATTREYLKKVYNSMQRSEVYKDQISSENDFLEIFNKKLIFVLSVKDTADNVRDLIDIESFDSNIAKFALNELVKNMKVLGVEFKINQIL